MTSPEHFKDILKEVQFSATRSGGAGGQNVNKVNTRVELRFSVSGSLLLSEDEKNLIYKKLASKINSEGEFILTAQAERTQYRNKQAVIERFINLLSEALKVEPPRLATKPTKASRIKRMSEKLKISQKKQNRRINIDE